MKGAGILHGDQVGFDGGEGLAQMVVHFPREAAGGVLLVRHGAGREVGELGGLPAQRRNIRFTK